MYQKSLSEYQSTVRSCPVEGCEYEGPSARSVSTHWAHKHEGPCPLTNDKKECVGCGTVFWASKALQRHRPMKYCTRECFESSTRIEYLLDCEVCAKEFEVDDGHEAKIRKYCSRECVAIAASGGVGRLQKACPECGDSFETTPSVDQTYCSVGCFDRYRDEGKTALNERVRAAEDTRGWRERVFERDDYTCQLCGERGGSLNAHHKTPVAEILDNIDSLEEAKEHPLFNDTSNGVTVCEQCHTLNYHRKWRKTKSVGGRTGTGTLAN